MREGLFTRSGKKITAVPHIREALKPFFEKYPNATLDGELYNHAYKDNFNKIIHLVRKQNLTEEHLAESKKMIQYWIYDAPVIGKRTEKDLFSDRTSVLDAQFANLKLDGQFLSDGETTNPSLLYPLPKYLSDIIQFQCLCQYGGQAGLVCYVHTR